MSEVSTHAPVKGATAALRQAQADAKGFNPRTREGCDARITAAAERVKSFNPRTREGCDGRYSPAVGYLQAGVSTHAPVKGATDDTIVPYMRDWFQPTHP